MPSDAGLAPPDASICLHASRHCGVWFVRWCWVMANAGACELCSGCFCCLAPCLCTERSTCILIIINRHLPPLWRWGVLSVPVLPTYQNGMGLNCIAHVPSRPLRGVGGSRSPARGPRQARRPTRHVRGDCSFGYGACGERGGPGAPLRSSKSRLP